MVLEENPAHAKLHIATHTKHTNSCLLTSTYTLSHITHASTDAKHTHTHTPVVTHAVFLVFCQTASFSLTASGRLLFRLFKLSF